jgi:hypothetical protein
LNLQPHAAAAEFSKTVLAASWAGYVEALQSLCCNCCYGLQFQYLSFNYKYHSLCKKKMLVYIYNVIFTFYNLCVSHMLDIFHNLDYVTQQKQIWKMSNICVSFIKKNCH